MKGRVLLMVGSPKASGSTSESLGTYLLNRLHERGHETGKICIRALLKPEAGRKKLLSAVNDADILILAFPLYVDSLPAPVIRALELIAKERRAKENPRKQRLIAILNCGFPEPRHNDTALAVCRRFAAESGIEWAGGLALGGGAAIDGRPLEQTGGMVRNVMASLSRAADLAASSHLSRRAIELMAKPMMPKWMYLWFGNRGWKRKARMHGVGKNINARPYEY